MLNFESIISRDRRLLRRWFLRNWKEDTLSFPQCCFLLNFDLRSSRYGRFENWSSIDRIRQNSLKFCKIYKKIKKKNCQNNCQIYRICKISNRSYLEIDASSGADSFEIGKRRLSAFQIAIFSWMLIRPARDTGNSNFCRRSIDLVESVRSVVKSSKMDTTSSIYGQFKFW